MSELNPTSCVFPHLGKRQREVLLKLCDGGVVNHYIEDMHPDEVWVMSEDGDEYTITVAQWNVIVKKAKQCLQVARYNPGMGISCRQYTMKEDYRFDTKLLLK